MLTDPSRRIPPYDAVILLSPRRGGDARFRAALAAADRRRSPSTAMRAANLSVDRDQDKQTPQQAAGALAGAIGR